MVKLVLIVLVAAISQGLCQRELPKDYVYQCLPKEGQGLLGVFEDWAKLNEDDYKKMLEFDSLRKVAEVFGSLLSDFRKVQESEAYKVVADYLCSKLYLHLDFYVDNAIAFNQYLLKEFAAKKPAPIDDEKNLENFMNLTVTLQGAERQTNMSRIAIEHSLRDPSLNEILQAVNGNELNNLVNAFLNSTELIKISEALNKTGIPATAIFGFVEYYAVTFWKRTDSTSGTPGGNPGSNSTNNSTGNSTNNSNGATVFSPSALNILYGLSAFYFAKKVQFLSF